MQSYVNDVVKAERLFEGVSDPHQMGTTGLTGWVYVGLHGRRLWNRFRTARSIIRKRLGEGSAKRFALACRDMSTNRHYREQIERYEKTCSR